MDVVSQRLRCQELSGVMAAWGHEQGYGVKRAIDGLALEVVHPVQPQVAGGRRAELRTPLTVLAAWNWCGDTLLLTLAAHWKSGVDPGLPEERQRISPVLENCRPSQLLQVLVVTWEGSTVAARCTVPLVLLDSPARCIRFLELYLERTLNLFSGYIGNCWLTRNGTGWTLAPLPP